MACATHACLLRPATPVTASAIILSGPEVQLTSWQNPPVGARMVTCCGFIRLTSAPTRWGGIAARCPLQGVDALSYQLSWQFPWFTLCSSLGSLSVPRLRPGGARLWVVWGFLFPLRFDSGGFCPGPNCLGRACSGSALQPQVTDPPRKGVLKGTMATWGWLSQFVHIVWVPTTCSAGTTQPVRILPLALHWSTT